MRADGRSLNARGYPEGAVVKTANSTPVVPARSSPSRREDEVGAERLWWSDAWVAIEKRQVKTLKWVLILRLSEIYEFPDVARSRHDV